jgi:hypothetical protein
LSLTCDEITTCGYRVLTTAERTTIMIAKCQCFLHRQEHGGQDCVFHFQDGLANYKAYNDLSWFRPLLGLNSDTSSDLILKMRTCVTKG